MCCFFVNFLCFGIANGNSNKTLHWLSNCRAKSACPVSLPLNSLLRQFEVSENPTEPPSLSRPKAWGVPELAARRSCQLLGAPFHFIQKRFQQRRLAPAPERAHDHRRKAVQRQRADARWKF